MHSANQFEVSLGNFCYAFWNISLLAAGSVHRSVGPGLLESVYQQAFGVELKFLGIPFSAQHPFKVYHRKQLVGE